MVIQLISSCTILGKTTIGNTTGACTASGGTTTVSTSSGCTILVVL